MKAYILIWVIFFASFNAQSQTVPQASGSTTSPLPPRVVYAQLFRHILFLDKQADLADQRGLSGDALRSFYQTQSNLTLAEATALKTIAANTVAAAKGFDDQATAIIQQIRAQFPGGKLPSKNALPPPPAQLQVLQDAKDKLILDQVAALQAAFGPDRFKQFDTFVQREFTPHLTVTPVGPAPSGTPNRQIAPFPPAQ